MKLITNLKQKVRSLKAEIQVLAFAYTDKRTSFIAKLFIGLTISYHLSPIDLIPDFIPVLGLLDDLVIVPLLIILSIRLIPAVVLKNVRQKVKDNTEKLKKNNWVVAVTIVLIWITTMVLAYRKLKYLFYKY